MELTKEQKQVAWSNWLAERPENVRQIAEKIVPWKKYRDARIKDDIGSRYRPISYEEEENGTVTITCKKTNEEMPMLGGYKVFGMSADNLIEAD